MEYIGIIAAEDKEIEAILNLMTNVSNEKIYNVELYKGNIKGISCLIAKAGVGKVNAARTAQIIIDKFDVSSIINIGAAGSTDEALKIGDIVISTGLVQHDFDVTAFGRERGFVPDVGKIFDADKKLIDLCEKAINLCGNNYRSGIIATGDRFVNNRDEKLKINKEFNAVCVEMEGASIAQVCKLSDIPFVVIRSISDELSGEACVEFENFLETASKKCADAIYNVIEMIKEEIG